MVTVEQTDELRRSEQLSREREILARHGLLTEIEYNATREIPEINPDAAPDPMPPTKPFGGFRFQLYVLAYSELVSLRSNVRDNILNAYDRISDRNKVCDFAHQAKVGYYANIATQATGEAKRTVQLRDAEEVRRQFEELGRFLKATY